MGGSAWFEERDGGDADSAAIATNAGTSRVEAHARGVGGNGVFEFSPMSGISGGDAHASASARGLGEAYAESIAESGAGSAGLDGSSRARADASGAIAEVRAVAALLAASDDPRQPRFAALQVAATARVTDGSAVAEATQSAGDFPPGTSAALALSQGEAPETPDAFVHAAHAPTSDALASALVGNAAVGAAFGRNADEILALVETGGGEAERDIVLGSDVDFTPGALDVGAGDELLIGFLDPALSGLKSLELRIELGEDIVLELSFTSGTAAEEFLDDRVFVFGIEPHEALSIQLDMETMAGAPRASLDFLVATVPEPPAVVLLALVLALSARSLRRGAALPRG